MGVEETVTVEEEGGLFSVWGQCCIWAALSSIRDSKAIAGRHFGVHVWGLMDKELVTTV